MIRTLLLSVFMLLVAPVSAQQNLATATFAAGCFWCSEEAFEKVPGVVSAVSGYIDGKTKNPSYEQVSSGLTGHCLSDYLRQFNRCLCRNRWRWNQLPVGCSFQRNDYNRAGNRYLIC